MDEALGEGLGVGVGVGPAPALSALDADLDQAPANVHVDEALELALAPASRLPEVGLERGVVGVVGPEVLHEATRDLELLQRVEALEARVGPLGVVVGVEDLLVLPVAGPAHEAGRDVNEAAAALAGVLGDLEAVQGPLDVDVEGLVEGRDELDETGAVQDQVEVLGHLVEGLGAQATGRVAEVTPDRANLALDELVEIDAVLSAERVEGR